MSLDSLVQTPDLKFIFVGGKGGVGKTTSSSAIASLLATNRRVLLVSTDPAHSLGDAWRTKFSNVPKRVIDETSNGGSILDIMEVDPQESLQSELKHWTEVSKELFASGGDGDGDMSAKVGQFQEWLSGIPGIDEATALSTAIIKPTLRRSSLDTPFDSTFLKAVFAVSQYVQVVVLTVVT